MIPHTICYIGSAINTHHQSRQGQGGPKAMSSDPPCSSMSPHLHSVKHQVSPLIWAAHESHQLVIMKPQELWNKSNMVYVSSKTRKNQRPRYVSFVPLRSFAHGNASIILHPSSLWSTFIFVVHLICLGANEDNSIPHFPLGLTMSKWSKEISADNDEINDGSSICSSNGNFWKCQTPQNTKCRKASPTMTAVHTATGGDNADAPSSWWLMISDHAAADDDQEQELINV